MPYASQLVVRVATEGIQETKRALDDVGKKTEETQGHFEGFKHALETLGVFKAFELAGEGVNILKEQLVDVVKVTALHQQITADTVNTLAHMGSVSGQTADSIAEYADKMSQSTMFTADATQKAENLMLTFGHLGKQVFPEATTAALNLSQKMGQDLQSSVVQIGKALDNPVTGFSALMRVGVSFSEEEKKQIKTLQAHNDLMGAQKIILSELNKQFGGDAVTAGKTFSGQLAIMGNQFEDIKIKIGGALLPVLSDLMNKYVVPLANQFADWMNKGGGLKDFQGWIQTASNFLQNQLIPAFETVLNQYVIPLGKSFYDLFINSGFASNVLSDITTTFQTLSPIVGPIVTGLTNLIEGLSKGGPGADIARGALVGIGGAIAAIKIAEFGASFIGTMQSMLGPIGNVVQAITGIGLASDTAKTSVVTNAGLEEAALGEEGLAGDAATAASEVRGIGAAASFSAGPVGLLGAALAGLIWVILNDIQTYKDNAAKGYNMPYNSGTGRYDTSARNPNAPGYTQGALGSGIHSLPTRRHASGILNNQVGHWATVGEEGPEPMFVPQGASILPHGMSPSNVGGGGQPIVLVMDGRQVGYGLMPHIVDNIRNTVGVRF